MEREKIKLTNRQWRDLVHENYIEVDGVIVDFTEIDDIYDGSRRHTEDHHKILQRDSDKKFFRIDYENSVKDGMGWCDCNFGNTVAVEVFPKEVTTIIYE